MRHVSCVVLALLVTCSRASADQPPPEGVEFFEKKIRPLLMDNCFKCHTGLKLKGHLAMDSRASLLKGGDSGPAFVPGDPGKSLLVKAIGYEDSELRMPPRGKLPVEQIAAVTAWIKMGAPWPAHGTAKTVVKKEFNLKERSGHWSLLPLKAASPPAVKNQVWVRSPIDAFLLAKLEEKGLAPAGPADKRTLLRRVTFDLIGLPPAPEEIEAFLADASPDAFAKVVDRLLASPHYGERWARHWLDLVRYAETQGHEFDFDIPDAWRYRDYLIRAFNADLPYGRLVTEHVAGDLVEKPRRHPVDRTNESILATGFWFLGEAKHSPVDVRGDQADRIDNQIDVFSKTFLALTLACARCHDHKFDAVSTKDYYGLAGFLQSSRQQRAFLDDPAPRQEKIRQARAVQDKACKLAVQESVAALRSRKNGWAVPLKALLGDKVDPDRFEAARQAVLQRFSAEEARANEARARAVVFADARRGGFRDWLPCGEAFPGASASGGFFMDSTTGSIRVAAPNPARSERALPSLQGALRSPTFVITKNKIHYRAAGRNGRVNLILDGLQLIRDPIYGQLTFVVNTRPAPAKGSLPFLEDAGPFQWHTMDVSMWIGHRAYVEVLDEGAGHVDLDQVVFSDELPPPEAPNGLVVNLLRDPASASLQQLMRAYLLLADTIIDQWTTGKLDGMPDVWDRIGLLNELLATVGMKKAGDVFKKYVWNGVDKEYTSISLPPPARALAMTDGSPVNEYVFIRGNHKNVGEVVPRRFLETFGGTAMGPRDHGSGRLELARDLVNPARTPIVPRVLVNRLWKHHFGEGIVRSPDDFGVLGQAPTHPELLDYLATEFVKNGWSIKKMHRVMLLSGAYRMDSRAAAASDEADPDNKLLHKMPVRRLEAEAVRDALLAVSGRLDRTQFGPSVPPHLTPFMVGRGRPDVSGPLDGNGRRSIYLGVRRNFLNPMFLAFDFPTPFSSMGKRSVSNVPAQALTMMNNPLVLQQADLWAKKTLAVKQAPRDRVTLMYVAALGRPPSAPELAEALAFVEEQGRARGGVEDPRAWADLGHVLYSVKEFIFVN
jgi:hypothetical protein